MLSVGNTQETKPFLKVLGAGYGRTGTMSLMHALNHLGYGKYNLSMRCLTMAVDTTHIICIVP
jgi:hypothetical protein